VKISIPKKVDWTKFPEPAYIENGEPFPPDVAAVLGFDPTDDPYDPKSDIARVVGKSGKSNKHSKKTESERRMPNNTSEKVAKGDFLKHYMTTKGADRKTESQLVDLAMEEYPGWKEKTISNYINWLKSTPRHGGLKADGLTCTLLEESRAVGERKSEEAAKQARRKHSAKLSIDDLCLSKKPIIISGYAKSGEVVCHLEINAAGLDLYGKNRKLLGKYTWEALVDKLTTR